MNDISFFGDITLETIPIFMMTAKRSLCNRINTLKSYIESKPDIARWKESDLFGRSYNIWCKFCWIRQWSTQQSPLLFSLDLGSAFKNFSHWSKLLDLCEVRYCTNLLMGTVTVVTHAVLQVHLKCTRYQRMDSGQVTIGTFIADSTCACVGPTPQESLLEVFALEKYLQYLPNVQSFNTFVLL